METKPADLQSSHLHFLTIAILVYMRRARKTPELMRPREAVTIQYGRTVKGSWKSGMIRGGGGRSASEGLTMVYL